MFSFKLPLFANYLRRLIHRLFMGSRIHEHDFLPTDSNNQSVQCRTCEAAYCILCGKRIAMIDTRRDHGVGKCNKSRQLFQGYEDGRENSNKIENDRN